MAPPKQQKGTVAGKKAGKQIKQAQNQKPLSFPSQANRKSTELKGTLPPKSDEQALLSTALEDAEAARLLPDESDDNLLEPGITHAKSVSSTNEFLTPTDSALVDLSTADFATIKMEKFEDASIQDSSKFPTQSSVPTQGTETTELFAAFRPGSDSSSDQSITTRFKGIYDEWSDEERELLNTTSGFVSVPTIQPSCKAESNPPDIQQLEDQTTEHRTPAFHAQADSTSGNFGKGPGSFLSAAYRYYKPRPAFPHQACL